MSTNEDKQDVQGAADKNGEVSEQQPPPEEPLPAIEDVVTREVVESIVAGYDDKLELIDYTAELGTKAGDNYMSIMYSLRIDMKDRASGVFANQIHVMLKTIPRNELRVQMINDCMAFIKEIKMYEEVLTEFVSFQESKGLNEEEIFREFPECYASLHNGKTDFLALKNLRIEKYGMGNRITGLDLEHTELCLKNIARFHAISYAMYQGDSDKILTKYPYLKEKVFPSPAAVLEPTKIFMKQTFKMQADLLIKEGFPVEGALVDRIYTDSFFDTMHELAGPNVKWPVIGHGDCWTNNMLFKYDMATKKPVTIKFLDFQLSRVSSRCLDIGYFLHTSPQMEIYNEKEEHLLKLYYSTFTEFLIRLGTHPEDHRMTLENFMAEYDEFRLFGVTMGFMLAPMLSAESSDVPDMEAMNEDMLTEEASKEFFGGMLKSSMALKKIKNLSQKHLPRCRGFEKAAAQ